MLLCKLMPSVIGFLCHAISCSFAAFYIVPVATAFGGDAWLAYGELRGLLGVVAPIAQTSARWYVTWHEGWGVTARVR